jgi:hypothetical protein
VNTFRNTSSDRCARAGCRAHARLRRRRFGRPDRCSISKDPAGRLAAATRPREGPC